jgi:hypothetical protein
VRKFVVGLVIVAAAVVAVGAYLAWTTPRVARGVSFPLGARDRALLAGVPESAEAFALIPNAAAVRARLESNPLSREALAEWTAGEQLPRPWMIGGADLIVWRSGRRTTYALALDPFRAVIVRTYLTLIGGIDARWNGKLFIINGTEEAPMAPAELDALLALGQGLPPGDALAVQRKESRGAFPPIGRPAVTSVRITPREIELTSRAPRPADAPPSATPVRARFPRGAILTAAFAAPNRAVDEMNRLFASRVSSLLAEGGTVVVYEVETDKLLPRPRGVIVLPATAERRAALEKFLGDSMPSALREAVGIHVETRDTGTELLVAFDRDSIGKYLNDEFDPAHEESNSWSLQVHPDRAVPMLEGVAGSPGLRFAAPRLFRSARDLAGWIERLRGASALEAADSDDPGGERLHVRIMSK